MGPQEGTVSSRKLPSELYRLQRIVWPLEWHHTAGPGEHTGSVISVSVFYKLKKLNMTAKQLCCVNHIPVWTTVLTVLFLKEIKGVVSDVNGVDSVNVKVLR